MLPEQTNLFDIPRKAVFLDRDGVLNYDSGYVHDKDHWEWIPGAISSIKQMNDNGWLVFVVTNQAGIARGMYSERDVRALHSWVSKQLAANGAHVDAFSYCPHHPDAKIEKYRKICKCRKPEPGMIMDILKKWNVNLKDSFLVGDKESDILAGKAAGLKTVLFNGPVLDLQYLSETAC